MAQNKAQYRPGFSMLGVFGRYGSQSPCCGTWQARHAGMTGCSLRQWLPQPVQVWRDEGRLTGCIGFDDSWMSFIADREHYGP